MKHIQIFFYNKIINKELFYDTFQNIKIIKSYILVENYDSENNKLTINKINSVNKKILTGLMIQFNECDILSEILQKLYKIKYNKSDYILDIINVNIYKDENTKAYIIL
jgi:hypothetical protein